jgi:putative cardiolipin synthase
MVAGPSEDIDTALAITELIDGDVQQLRALEGYLLTRSAAKSSVSPAGLASTLDLSVTAARDICRQLESADAVTQTVTPVDPQDAEYDCNSDRCVTVLETAVTATRILQQDRARRRPFPMVKPVTTLPADPRFSRLTPQDLGFDWLMPSLSSEINQASEEIMILMPFFEQDGFNKLQPDLTAALDRGVTITIVTRYLSDPNSNNHKVLSEFVSDLREGGISCSNLQFVEYAQQSGGDGGERAEQGGDPPEFTLHAKVMIFDSKAVYIGSANVTDYGFDRYLELGVLLQGPPVLRYRKLGKSLLESAAAHQIDLI